MSKIIKFWKAGIGLVLMAFRIRFFNPERIFDGKRIAIVGPADSAYDEMKGVYIDQFDLVIRINKAITTWKPENEKYIGTKTDVLVHCFLEGDSIGGGPLDFDFFKKHKIKYILNPKNHFAYYRHIFNAYKKYLTTSKIYILPKNKFNDCEILFKDSNNHGRGATTGFRTLFMVLSSKPKEVYITGFTFFKTPYADGYRDQLKDTTVNLEHMKKRGAHDPDFEYSLFIELLKNSTCNVILDSKLKSIVENKN